MRRATSVCRVFPELRSLRVADGVEGRGLVSGATTVTGGRLDSADWARPCVVHPAVMPSATELVVSSIFAAE